MTSAFLLPGAGNDLVLFQGGEPAPAPPRVDIDIIAMLPHTVYIVLALKHKALGHERRFKPRPIQAADIHAEIEIAGIYFQGMEHQLSSPPYCFCPSGQDRTNAI
jgi:hypothetical protein